MDPDADPRPERGGAYDHVGGAVIAYAPERDGEPDPGEVVWVWVPYEEDPRQGKDRPVVVIGRATGAGTEGDLAVLMLSSRDHDGDRGWAPIGAGEWDRDGRESWVRVDRLLATSPEAVRREGALLTRAQFDAVVAAAR